MGGRWGDCGWWWTSQWSGRSHTLEMLERGSWGARWSRIWLSVALGKQGKGGWWCHWERSLVMAGELQRCWMCLEGHPAGSGICVGSTAERFGLVLPSEEVPIYTRHWSVLAVITANHFCFIGFRKRGRTLYSLLSLMFTTVLWHSVHITTTFYSWKT
jgi:hypothetical protein